MSIGNDGIRSVMAMSKFEDVLQTSIFWITQKMIKVTKITKSDPLSTILTRVLVILFQIMILQALTSIE